MKIEFTANALKSIKAICYPNLWRRFRNRWIDIKDFCWNRWTTVKPRGLSHGWHDRDYLLIHVMFQVLCDFVEKEMRPENIREARDANWTPETGMEYYRDWDEETKIDIRDGMISSHEQDKELLAIYDWWTKEYPNYSIENGPYISYKNEMQEYDKVTEMAIRLVKIRSIMWT